MAEREFTKQQRRAIDDRGHTLLVSAAAGSGKTTVLINRIVGIITDEKEPVDLANLLVVTYTKAAAAEIRDRLSAALSAALSSDPSNRRLLRQLAMVPSAKIDTMDAFFLDVIRKNFDKAGLSANFSVCDEGTSDIMLGTACEELVNEYYESEPEDGTFYKLIENLKSSGNDAGFVDTVKKLYKEIFSFADTEAYFDLCTKEYDGIANGTLDFTNTSFYKAIADDISLLCAHTLEDLSEALCITKEDKAFARYSPCIENLHTTYKALVGAKTYKELREASVGYQKVDFGSSRGDPDTKEFIKGVRETAETLLQNTLVPLFGLKPEELRICCEEYATFAHFMKDILIKLDDKFSRLKKSKGVINFADMKRLCYGLLFEKKDGVTVPSALAHEVAKDYKEIFIDEYQDTDTIQDEIFASLSALSGANRFMVGDMKQCIYAFRGSEPKLFANYYNAYPMLGESDGKNAKIVLSDNFRSDSSVINTVNLIFKSLMRKRLSDLDYDEAQALVKGKLTDENLPVELFITQKAEGETPTQMSEKQARNCALEIARLINEKKYEPKDIAILTRFNKRIPLYKKALSELGIESKSSDGVDVFASAEIRLVRAVLYAVDNPARDVYLASALCSPVFGMTFNDIARLRVYGRGSLYEALCSSEDESAKNAVAYLKELKKISLSGGIDKLIFKIIKDSGLDRAVKREKNGAVRYKNLLRFISLSKSYNSGSYRGLSDFLSYCESLERTKSAQGSEKSGAGVTISSMHSSKGLEYKVCFVTDCERDLFNNRGGPEIIHGKDLPFAFALLRQGGFVKVNTPPTAALNTIKRYSPVAEELRLLYVALTRAKEKLYISFAVDMENFEKTIGLIDKEKSPASDYFLLSEKTHLNFILRGIAAGSGQKLERIFHLDKGIEPYLRVRFVKEDTFEATEAVDSAPEKTEYETYPDYVYPHTARSLIPAKISVSDLGKEGERENLGIRGELPSFMSPLHATAAQRGTAMHSFMQFCDFEAAAADVEKEAKRLSELGFISRAQAEILDFDALGGFFRSELYAQMKNAVHIYREQRYNLLQSASKYYDAPEANGQTLLIQGVIDCFFENASGEIILVDFKTDRVSKDDGESVLRARHTPQLELYADAVELMLKKKPVKAYVYSFALEREILCLDGGAYAT